MVTILFFNNNNKKGGKNMKKIGLLFIFLIIIFCAKAEKKAPLKVIEGIITMVEPPVIGESRICFMLEGVKEIFVVDCKVCPEADFISIISKVKISFRKTGKPILYCKSFEILEIIANSEKKNP